MKPRNAFSLIELSIVLIIIGLLVAGIVGGSSLIQSARVRAFLSEAGNLEQSVHIFLAAQGRLPGDVNNIGKFGSGSDYNTYTYSSTDFSPPFEASFAINVNNAPFIDLYNEKILDFKPASASMSSSCKSNYATPCSKILGSGYYRFELYMVTNSATDYRAGLYNKQLLQYNDSRIPPKIAYQIDTKGDDGIKYSGKIRGFCINGDTSATHATYEVAIDTKGYCSQMLFRLDLP